MAGKREKRVEDRLQTDRRATARLALSVELEDVSARGLRMKCPLRLPAGTMIRFTLPGAIETHARVVWADGEHIGCDLLRNLTVEEVALITAPSKS